MIFGMTLVNGMTLVGRSADGVDSLGAIRRNEVVTLKKARMVAIIPRGENQISVSLQPYNPLADDEDFDFHMKDILNVFNPNADLCKGYTEVTTGLVLAGANDLPVQSPFA